MTGRSLSAERAALMAASLGFGIIIMATTAINVAVPSVRASLGGGVAGSQWCVNGFTVTFSSLLIPCGGLADRYGGRRTFIWGMAIFVIASAGSAAAPTLWALVLAQALAGCGAANLAPACMALITETFPAARARTRAVSLLSLGLAAGFGIGPVMSGVLIAVLGWRTVFLFNVPCGVVLAVVAYRLIPRTAPHAGRSIGPIGALCAVVALASLTLMLIEAGSAGLLAGGTLIGLAASLLGAGAFVVSQRRTSAPLVPSRLLAVRTIPGASVVGLAFNFVIYGQLFVLSLYFQRQLHLSALATGVLFLPEAIGTVLIATTAGHWIARDGFGRPLLVGMVLTVVGTLTLLGTGSGAALAYPVIGLLLTGVAGGIVIPALNSVVSLSAPGDLTGVAAATFNAGRQVGGVIGVAVLGSLIGSEGDAGARVDVALLVCAGVQLCGVVIGLRVARASPAQPGRPPVLESASAGLGPDASGCSGRAKRVPRAELGPQNASNY